MGKLVLSVISSDYNSNYKYWFQVISFAANDCFLDNLSMLPEASLQVCAWLEWNRTQQKIYNSHKIGFVFTVCHGLAFDIL